MFEYTSQYVPDLVKIFVLAAIAFLVSVVLTPVMTHFLYKYKLGKHVRNDGNTPVYSQLHKKKEGTPTMGGILIWLTTLSLALFISALAAFTKNDYFDKLDFLTRKETWLPLAALVLTAIVGLFDDIMNVWKRGSSSGGLRMKHRLLLYTIVAAVGAWWFFYKLEWDVIHIPGSGDIQLGWLYIPLFILVIVSTAFSANEIDGLDGLAGGTLLAAFASYTGIAFIQGKIDLAAFCAVIMGALLSFLWFNIPPARFIMGDTGVMSLGTTLGIVAMLTNSALVLPIIAFPLVITSLSVIVQVTSKKFFKRKVFQSAPLHHHLEAIGWPESKIVMRFWVIAAIFSAIGLIIGIIGRG